MNDPFAIKRKTAVRFAEIPAHVSFRTRRVLGAHDVGDGMSERWRRRQSCRESGWLERSVLRLLDLSRRENDLSNPAVIFRSESQRPSISDYERRH
jgi:hypothetical protein